MNANELKCGYCGRKAMVEDYDDEYSCCPGNVFCPECDNEISASNGELQLLCGECDACNYSKNLGEFDEMQADREKTIRNQRSFLEELFSHLNNAAQPSDAEVKE